MVPGCEVCRKRLNTNSQYLRHLADDVLPGIIEDAFSAGPKGLIIRGESKLSFGNLFVEEPSNVGRQKRWRIGNDSPGPY